MNYIIVDGHVVGIANNNYDELSAHPSINNTILDIAKNYSSEDLNIIKVCSKADYDAMASHNPNTVYYVYTDIPFPTVDSINYLDVANKPSINNIILTGNKSLKSLNIYSIDEVDNMMASMRSIKVVPTKPAISDVVANTLYYVGTAAPYQVYLYDSNKTEARLGTSEVDLSAYVKKESIATTIDANSTNDEVASAKAVYDYSAPLTIGYSGISSGADRNANNCVWNMEPHTYIGTYRLLEKRIYSNVAITVPVSNTQGWGDLEVTQSFSKDTNSANHSLKITQTFTANYITNIGDTRGYLYIFRRIGYLAGVSNEDITSNASSITWNPWYPIEYPRFAISADSTYVSGGALYGSVTGGILTVRGDSIRFVIGISTMAAVSICRISGIDPNAVKYINADNFQYAQLIAFNPSQQGVVSHLIGLVKSTENNVSQLAIACWKGGVDYPTTASEVAFFSISCGLGY